MTTNIFFEAQFTDNPNAAQIVRIFTDASLATIEAAGWLNSAVGEGYVLSPKNKYLISYNSGANVDFFNLAVVNHVYTLTIANADVILPTVANSIAVFSNTTGTLTDNIPAVNTVTEASATPGTVRSITGAISDSVLMTSGNLVGVRGQVTYVGASGGFIYGAQGKVICTGALTSSEWSAGIFGQLDISAATINGGQIAPIWGDYGSTSGTLTSETGCYGIAMTNTTAVVTIGQLYLYGGATNLMYLNTNAGLSGVTYFKTSGTASGSWGNATPPTPSKVLTISVDGTTYYLPLVAQNT